MFIPQLLKALTVVRNFIEVMTQKKILKFILHKESLIFAFGLMFLWFTISLYADSTIKKSDLIAHSGKLLRIDSVIIRIKNKPLFKEVTKELRLTLENESNYYTSITTNNFGNIISYIQIGDDITIYTKHKFLGVFGLQKNNNISQLEKGNIVIIDLQEYEETIPKMTLFSLIASISFFVFFYFTSRRRYNSIKSEIQ